MSCYCLTLNNDLVGRAALLWFAFCTVVVVAVIDVVAVMDWPSWTSMRPSWTYFGAVIVCGRHCCGRHGFGRHSPPCGRHGLWPSSSFPASCRLTLI